MLPDGMLREVTAEEIEAYERDGVVKLEGILAPEVIAKIERGIQDAMYTKYAESLEKGQPILDATASAEALKGAGVAVLTDERAEQITDDKRGRFFAMVGANQVSPDLHDVAMNSPLGYIASRLFGASKVNFYDDQTLVKESSSKEYTSFHTDEPYFHLSGEQVCGMWISPDVVTPDSGAMRYVRGSHRWGSFFKANVFVGQTAINALLPESTEDEGQIQLPDIEGNESEYDIVTIPSNPGDIIVHHSNLIHGSGPNYRSDRPRRAVSYRYAGDDVRYKFHKSAPPQPHQTRHNLKDGDVIDSEQFPVVWRA